MINGVSLQGAVHDFGKVHPIPVYLDEPSGIRYDFNDGLRVATPEGEQVWELTIVNKTTGDKLVDRQLMPAGSNSSFPFKYYIDYAFEIVSTDGRFKFFHRMELAGRTVAFKMCQRTLGDPIALFSFIPAFVAKHNCRALVYAPPRIAELLKSSYPDMEFRDIANEDTGMPYATYYLGLFFGSDEQNRFYQPQDFRLFGLHEQAKHILGLEATTPEAAPMMESEGTRPIQEKYVCISYTGSKANKFWQNPNGWFQVIDFLRREGYRIICIDRDKVYGQFPYINQIPYGTEDCTGERPLASRLHYLKHADMFIGMASGLAWLAWCARTPVIMISGFSAPYAEFYTPYRVFNPMAPCHSCWNDTRIVFDRHTYNWCPRIDAKIKDIRRKMAALTDEEAAVSESEIAEMEAKRFCCTKTISGESVIRMIKRVREDKGMANKQAE